MTRPISLRMPHALADPAIDIDEDRFILRNVSVIQRGPALGHGFEVDDVMLKQVADGINAARGGRGVKSRLTHPGLTECGGKDGIEVTLGRVRDARVDGDRVRGDVHLGKYAAFSPQGDLRQYLLAIAREDPELVGLSIVFEPDQPVEKVVDEPRPESRQTDDGNHIVQFGRVKQMLAADFVGDPAANADGLVARLPALVRHGITPQLLSQWMAQAGHASGDDPHSHEPEPAPSSGGGGQSTHLLQERPIMGDDIINPKDTTPKINPETDANANAATLQSARQEAAELARSEERERVSEIRALATHTKLGDTWAAEMIVAGKSVGEAKDEALKALAKLREPTPGLGGPPSVTGGSDLNRESLADAISDAIFIKYGKQDELYKLDADGRLVRDQLGNPIRCQPHERSRQFHGMTMSEITRQFLTHVGVNTYAMGKQALAQKAFSRAVTLSHTTSDFPKILADTIGKRARTQYQLRPATWNIWASRSTAPDFKTISRPALGTMPVPPVVMEGAEYTYAKIGEEGETYTLGKYGQLFQISWEAIINDDLGVFRRADMIGNSFTALEDDLAYAQLTANAAMADGDALFHASHGNLASGSGNLGAPTVALLGNARSAMALQRGIKPDTNTLGAHLNLEARYILVPHELETVTAQLIASTVDPAKSNATPNPQFIRSLTLVSDGRLSANSTTAWYVVADKAQADTVEVCFLEGNEIPFVEEQDNFKVDGRTWKMRHTVAAKVLDYRGLFKNPGA